MERTTLTLGHSPDPDDAFMFYALAKELIPTHGSISTHFAGHPDAQRARHARRTRHLRRQHPRLRLRLDKYALLPSGASMGDNYGPMLVAKQKFTREEIAKKKIAVPGP